MWVNSLLLLTIVREKDIWNKIYLIMFNVNYVFVFIIMDVFTASLMFENLRPFHSELCK